MGSSALTISMSNRPDPRPKLGGKRGSLSKIGDMQDLKAALWEVIAKLKDEIANQGQLLDVIPLKAAHTLATLAGVFVRLHETADLESRLTALEQRIESDKGGTS
jgi:hypothetical protein